MNRTPAILLVVLFLLSACAPMSHLDASQETSQTSSAKATGVDLTVTNVSFSYTTSADEGRYRMFSSNHPIPNFNRPAELYVVDAVIDVPIYSLITVDNLGTASSGTIDVVLKTLHNEYQQFEMTNTTQQMSSLSGGSSNTIGITFTPTYSGNHTLEVTATSSVADDQPSNDALYRHFTVASHYFNCDDLTQWTATNEWGINSDTSLSEASACHAGNGVDMAYSSSTTSVLETPAFDMSDAVENPLRTNGLSFFYTGSSQTGDELKVYVQNSAGANTQLGNIAGTVDQVFIDGASWQTFSVNSQGATSPLIPAPQSGFSPATKFRFVFTADASGNDVGFWLDDIVIMYDQKVKPIEYAISSAGISTIGSLPDEWGGVQVSLTNEGNISDYVLPSIDGLPSGWEVYFAHLTGVSINEQTGVLLSPGESKTIEVKIRPDVNATTGFEQMTFIGTSSQYESINTTLPVQFQVLPDREPFIVQPDIRPTCPPGYSCPFTVEVRNIGDATDVFDLTIEQDALPEGWTVQLAWTQSTSIMVRPDTPVQVALTMTVPTSAAPDTVAPFTLIAQSQNNTAKQHQADISVSASMISEAYIGMTTTQMMRDWLVDAGETKTVEFTIWNNATRQDIFSMQVTHGSVGLWTIEQPTRPDAVINPGASTTFTVKVTAPETGQAGDKAPSLTPTITSKRSGMSISGDSFDSIVVRTISDLSITLLETPDKLRPGTANKVLLEIVNKGNGPIDAIVAADGLPSAWNTWIKVNGDNVTDSIALSAPYDLNNNATVEMWIFVPSEEAASEIHTISIMVSNAIGFEDIHIEDNSVTFDTITASVRIPDLVGSAQSQSAMVGDTVSVNATLRNIGNAADDGIIVLATFSSSPPEENIIAFFTTSKGGASKSVGEAVTMMLLPNQSTTLTVDLILPDTMILNTRIVVSFEVIAGLNAEMQPYELRHEALIIVDQQRQIGASLSTGTDEVYPTGTGVPLFVNITSTSSQREELTLRTTLPESWQMVCNGILVDREGQNLTFEPGHVAPQLSDVPCTLHRLGGPLGGIVTFQLETQDGARTWQSSQAYSFSERTTDQTSMNVGAVAGGGGVLMAFIFLMSVLLRRRSKEEFVDEPKIEPHEFQTSGPPASTGPPISAQQASTPEAQAAEAPAPAANGPDVPLTGLPTGWTMEQWTHYGQQYLDRLEGQA